MKNLTKEQVYVLIDNQPDCDRAIEILTKAGEKLSNKSDDFDINCHNKYLKFWNNWYIGCYDKELTQVTLEELERILMPKIKKAELLERIEKLENKVADLEEKSKVTVVYPPTWANDPSTVIGKGTIEIEAEKPLDKITGVNESVEALKNMLLRKGVLTEQDFDGHFAIQQYGTDNTYPTREIVIDTIEAEKPAFEVGKVYKLDLAMFYCTRIKYGKLYGFGFNLCNNWVEDNEFSWKGDFIEATPEEWFNRLDEEYNRRGFKKGVTFNNSKLYERSFEDAEMNIDFLQLRGLNTLSVNEYKDANEWYEIMKDGKWAEIIEEQKPAFEVGKVYKDGLAMFYCTRIEDGKPFGFGFDLIGQWWEDDGDFWAGDFTEATPEEWFSRLEEEAKKKYPKGCKVKCLHNSIYNKIDTLNFTGYHSDTGCLRHKDSNNFVCCVMQDGKWAEIIEEPQYQAGTLGAFWDGDFDEAMDNGSVRLGHFSFKSPSGQFVPQEINMCFQNFKPLKFD